MNSIKKMLLVGLSLLLLCSQAAWAELPGAAKPAPAGIWVTDLDNQHLDKCQQKLMESKDQFPIILLYSSTGEGKELSDLFMPTYVAVALLKHSERSFYRFDIGGNAEFSLANECLGFSGGLVVPTVNVVTFDTEAAVLTNPLRAIGGLKMDPKKGVVSISPLELITAITLPFPTEKGQAATQVVISNHSKKH